MRPRGVREKHWVVREGDGVTIADIVRRAGEPESAVEDGRVPTEPDFPTFADGHEEILLCDAIAESAEKGAWIEVPR